MIKLSISKLGGESITIHEQGRSTTCLRNPKVEGITALASLSPFQIVQSCAGIEWFSIDRPDSIIVRLGGKRRTFLGEPKSQKCSPFKGGHYTLTAQNMS